MANTTHVDVSAIHNKLEGILSDNELNQIIDSVFLSGTYSIEKIALENASKGLCGFLGDHYKLKVIVSVNNNTEEVNMFIKAIPKTNEVKRAAIIASGFFVREEFMYRLFQKVHCKQDFHSNVYLCNESILVMPDLTFDGYKTRDRFLCYDLAHCTTVIKSIAKLHGAAIMYELSKCAETGKKYRLLDEYPDKFKESNFLDNDWMKSGAKLIYNVMKCYRFNKIEKITEHSIHEAMLKAASNIRDYKETVNTIIHKDLWCNNIMFKYENNQPTNAMIIDYQCIRYAPPAFDIISMLYLNTSAQFRDKYQDVLYECYITSLVDAMDGVVVLDSTEFKHWIGRAKLSGMVIALMIFPYTLLDEMTGQELYDNPKTFDYIMNVDRSGPFIDYCNKNAIVKKRFLEVSEEFISLIKKL